MMSAGLDPVGFRLPAAIREGLPYIPAAASGAAASYQVAGSAWTTLIGSGRVSIGCLLCRLVFILNVIPSLF